MNEWINRQIVMAIVGEVGVAYLESKDPILKWGLGPEFGYQKDLIHHHSVSLCHPVGGVSE